MSGQMQMGMPRPSNGLFHHPMQHPGTALTPDSKQDAQGSGAGPTATVDGQGTSSHGGVRGGEMME